jgi:hypothetical protein
MHVSFTSSTFINTLAQHFSQMLKFMCNKYNSCNAPTLLNERRKWKSPIATKRYYLFLDIIRDYKSCNGNSIYKILIKHTKAENQTYILNKSVPCTLHNKKPY